MEENKPKDMMEEKAEALLDETPEKADEGSDQDKQKKKKPTPEEQLQELRKLCSGTMKLMAPFRSHGQDVTEITYDFCKLTGMDMVSALDETPSNNLFAISNAQAMSLFAMAAEKCAPTVKENDMVSKLYDAKDVKNRLSAPDFSYALRIAKLFYTASSQAGSNNTSKE